MTSVLKFPKPPKRVKAKRKGSRTPNARVIRKRLAKKCDELWSLWVKRDGRCHWAGKPDPRPKHRGTTHVCLGSLQAMHGIPRGYHGTRLDLRNGIPGCGAIHTYYTHHGEEWDHWLLGHWGREEYDQMWELATAFTKLDFEKLDYEAELLRLQFVTKAFGVAA